MVTVSIRSNKSPVDIDVFTFCALIHHKNSAGDFDMYHKYTFSPENRNKLLKSIKETSLNMSYSHPGLTTKYDWRKRRLTTSTTYTITSKLTKPLTMQEKKANEQLLKRLKKQGLTLS